MSAERARPPALARRLAAAGIDDVSDPLAAWIRLREAEGRRTTGVRKASLRPSEASGTSTT